MINQSFYSCICYKKENIPSDALQNIPQIIKDNLGNDFRSIYESFALSFPLVADGVERFWGRSGLALKKYRGIWLFDLVFETESKNLYFNLHQSTEVTEGREFEDYHKMLPHKWLELYRHFDSFVLTDESIRPMDWWNTPFSYASRLNLDQYMEGSGATKSQTKAFAKKLNCDRNSLRCWLLTENEDALFINEKACDRKVYHVKGTAFEDVFELPDPELTLDKYLAHVVSGQSPATFDFRA